MIAVPMANGLALRSTGELFIAGAGSSTISRFLSPLGTPTASGMITGNGLSSLIEEMRFVDDELWVVNPGASNLIRLAFDAQGNAKLAGTISNLGNDRGMLWNPTTRDLYVSECCGTNTIQHFQVATDHTTSKLPNIAVSAFNNPHGLALTPWGELLVANRDSNEVLRFTVDSAGNATANGIIQGNGLNLPESPAFTPWGELIIVNQGDQSLSRFTFDASHTATPNGSFQTYAVVGQFGLGWIIIVAS
jgi:DNA-binding beta-propeller fold protein YncE